jgi:thiamine pyrophosphate-dependent acetolactate synthase large subunit-like protein
VVAHHLNDLLAQDAIISTDAGTVTTSVARHIRMIFPARPHSRPWARACPMKSPRSSLFLVGSVALVVDGGFSMLMADFATAVKYELPITIIVIKNNTLE